jgi:MSHA pilin protein MshC
MHTLFPLLIWRRQRGFTLAELVAVIVITAILAVSATAYFSRSAFDSAAFADLAKSVVSQAQKVAVAQRRTVFVVASASTLSVCYDALCASPVASAGAASGAGGFNAPTAMVYTAPSGVSLAPVSFSFDGIGKPSAAVSIIINGTSAFSVAAETGYVY